jgi:hypothetical protein
MQLVWYAKNYQLACVESSTMGTNDNLCNKLCNKLLFLNYDLNKTSFQFKDYCTIFKNDASSMELDISTKKSLILSSSQT